MPTSIRTLISGKGNNLRRRLCPRLVLDPVFSLFHSIAPFLESSDPGSLPLAVTMPTMMVQPAAMRRLRLELETSRMRAALAPAGGVSKKPSPPRLCSAPSSSPAPLSARHAQGDTRLGHAQPSPFVISRPRHAAAQDDNKTSSISFSKGAQVRVRTPVATLRTGQRLVLWLGAVVVSAAEEEDGYLCVAYTHYKLPGCDPLGSVRVPKKDVKDMLLPATATSASAGSSTVTSSHSAAPPQGDQPTAAPVRRPTTAGKSPALLKKMEKEMRSKSDAILASW
ncbi:hypothetical protein EJB05_12354, partial [Eragrostis curvula]